MFDRRPVRWIHPRAVLIGMLVLFPFLIAARLLQTEIPANVELVLAAILAVLVGSGSVRPIGWLKDLLKLEGSAALWFVWFVSVVVAAVAFIAAGYFVGFELTPERVTAFAGIYFAAVDRAYKATKGYI